LPTILDIHPELFYQHPHGIRFNYTQFKLGAAERSRLKDWSNELGVRNQQLVVKIEIGWSKSARWPGGYESDKEQH
jgi:hypothetical protein